LLCFNDIFYLLFLFLNSFCSFYFTVTSPPDNLGATTFSRMTSRQPELQYNNCNPQHTTVCCDQGQSEEWPHTECRSAEFHSGKWRVPTKTFASKFQLVQLFPPAGFPRKETIDFLSFSLFYLYSISCVSNLKFE
jgi:hypothetical protein